VAANGPTVTGVMSAASDAASWPVDRIDATRRGIEPWQRDVLIAVGVAFVELVGTHFAGEHQPERYQWDALGVSLLLVGPALLVVRRRYPRFVLAGVHASALTYWVIGYVRGPIFLAPIVALGTAVVAGYRRDAVIALVLGFAGFLWLPWLLGREDPPPPGAVLGLAAWLLVLLAVAEMVRARHERVVNARQLREEEARRRVSDERLRIARELHDVVAHNISLINVQAATTLHLMNGDEAPAREALAAIKTVSQETLVELRSVLGVLRHVDESAPRGPAPTLRRLDELIDRTTAAGLTVEVDVRGVQRELPVHVDLAAYRIVQEALTNVARHSTANAATVTITFGPDDLVVQIDDEGRPATGTSSSSALSVSSASPVPGNGITGMIERATALGGNVQAAPRAGGGFRVRAWLPVRDQP